MYHEQKDKAKIMPKRHESILKANNAALLILGFTGLFIAVSLLFLELTGCLELLMSLF
jgi:hypothetical protein